VKKLLYFFVAAIGITIIIFLVIRYAQVAKFNAGDFEISEVEIGTVLSTFPAEGTVEPESEVLILSPASSIVQRIVKDLGSKVEAGDAIIILDPTPVQEQIEKLQDQLEVKRNSLTKNQLNARSTRLDLDYNVEVRKLRIASLKSELADQEQLLDVGGISPAKYEKTKQELVLAEKDLETLSTRNSIKLQQLDAEEEGLKLQIAIQEKELEHQEHLLQKMIVRAPSAGIILAMEAKVGEKVNTDKLLVKMSNLSNFKIKASSDEKHSEHIQTGRQVIVDLDGEQLNGQVGTVSPVISNKKVKFDVFLEESNHWKLRPNLTLPMRVVVSRADSVMRLKYGPSVQRASNFGIYKIEGDVAIQQDITTGLQGDNYIEIVSGAEPGTQLIISDVSLFRNKEQVDFQK
jgi:HlyD family secretion protein